MEIEEKSPHQKFLEIEKHFDNAEIVEQLSAVDKCYSLLAETAAYEQSNQVQLTNIFRRIGQVFRETGVPAVRPYLVQLFAHHCEAFQQLSDKSALLDMISFNLHASSSNLRCDCILMIKELAQFFAHNIECFHIILNIFLNA